MPMKVLLGQDAQCQKVVVLVFVQIDYSSPKYPNCLRIIHEGTSYKTDFTMQQTLCIHRVVSNRFLRKHSCLLFKSSLSF